MHMADALISPIVGGAMTLAAAGLTAHSIKKVQINLDEKRIPLMGVMGAFIFAAQMINFSIPGTGSSGHLGGGLLLAILLGPHAGFLTMASVLVIQALFFGDGGLIALGCNIINLGFFTCYLAYPYIYGQWARRRLTSGRIAAASLISAIAGLQMGSLGVVLETVISGKTALPFSTFLMMMQPIHLAIGAVEGLVTAAVVSFIWKARPEILESAAQARGLNGISIGRVTFILLAAAVLTGGVLSWFASSDPDGLEWSVDRTVSTVAEGKDAAADLSSVEQFFAQVQDKTAVLPDYSFKKGDEEGGGNGASASDKAGTSTSGILGGGLTLLLALFAGSVANFLKNKKKAAA